MTFCRWVFVLAIFALLLGLAACGGNESGEAEDEISAIAGNIFVGDWRSENASHRGWHTFFNFAPNGVVELLYQDHTRSEGLVTNVRLTKYYGIYEAEGNRVTITISFSTTDETIMGIIHEDQTITIAGNSFHIWNPETWSATQPYLAENILNRFRY
jgi:hypothetical protein